jgi:hypothetical protein
LIGMALYLFGLYDMCVIPAESGVRGLMRASAWIVLAAFLCTGLGLVLLLLSALTARSSRSDAFMLSAITTMTFLAAAVLTILGAVLFLFVLRGIAVFFGDQRLAQSVLVFFFSLIIGPAAAVLVLFCLLGKVGYYRDATLVATVMGLVVDTILSIWFFSLLRDVRARVDNARRRDQQATI